MSDSIWIVLIIAVVVVVILFIFRRQLRRFILKINQEGLEAELETHEPVTGSSAANSATDSNKRASVNITGSRQIGRGNKMRIGRSDVNISDVDQIGDEQEIEIEPDPFPKKRKKK